MMSTFPILADAVLPFVCGMAMAFFAVLSLPFLVLFVVGVVKNSRGLKLAGGIPACGLLLMAMCSFGAMFLLTKPDLSETDDPDAIATAFRDNMKMEPGADFVPLHKQTYWVVDSGDLHLAFKASLETFEKITAMGFERVSPRDFLDATRSGVTPAWWVKDSDVLGECFKNEKWQPDGKSTASSVACVHYDAQTGTVYFFNSTVP